jgi:glycerol uptake facilitator-like aquaporin
VSSRLDHLWIYLAAPVAGAAAGVLIDRCIRGPGQAPPPDNPS